MNLKHIISITILSITTLLSQDFRFKPLADIELKYENKDKEYSVLGQSIYKKDQNVYDEYLLGGELGVKSSYMNYDLVVKYHGIARIKESDQKMKKNEHILLHHDNFVGYGYFGDLHINANFDNFLATVGRQTYDNRLVGTNKETTSNSYEGAYLEYKNNRLKVDGFYFNSVASSPLAYVVNENHPYAILGYGMGYRVGEYTKVAEHILGLKGVGKHSNGALNINIKYGTKNTNLHIENLYVDNFFNTLSITGRYNLELGDFDINTKIGIVTQNEVGANNFEGNIDSMLYQGRLKLSYDKFKLTYKLSQTDTNKDALYNGTLISPFSNKPAWIYGPKTAHAFIANTFSQQFSISNIFYIGKMPIPILLSHIRYDIGDDNGLELLPGYPTPAMDTRETYIDIKTYFSKELSLTYQYSFAKNITPIVETRKNIKFYLRYIY